MKSIFFAILIVLNLGDVNSSIDWPLADPQVEGKFLSNFVATCTLLFWSPCAMDETTHFFYRVWFAIFRQTSTYTWWIPICRRRWIRCHYGKPPMPIFLANDLDRSLVHSLVMCELRTRTSMFDRSRPFFGSSVRSKFDSKVFGGSRTVRQNHTYITEKSKTT